MEAYSERFWKISDVGDTRLSWGDDESAKKVGVVWARLSVGRILCGLGGTEQQPLIRAA